MAAFASGANRCFPGSSFKYLYKLGVKDPPKTVEGLICKGERKISRPSN